jgi:hypothetical protein
LHKLGAPELVEKPIVISKRPFVSVGRACPFERIEAEVGDDRHINFDRAAEPTGWLVGEAILEVVDSYPFFFNSGD